MSSDTLESDSESPDSPESGDSQASDESVGSGDSQASPDDGGSAEPSAGDGSAGEPSAGDAAETREDLLAQVELLADENRRLREEYVRARRTTHRRTALGLFAVGTVAALAGLALPGSRTVLFALAGTGLFAGVLTYFLTPERFVSAGTGERVYAALAATGGELVAELGLRDDRVYAPARGTDADFAGVRLFVPQRPDYVVPPAEELDSLFVVPEDERGRGVALAPTGGALYREFETGMAEEVADAPGDLAVQLAEALAEGFELVESATADADPEGGRVTVEITGGVYGTADRFDHPTRSFLAVGLAVGLDAPVRSEVVPDEDSAADYLVVCEWDPDDVEFADVAASASRESENEE